MDSAEIVSYPAKQMTNKERKHIAMQVINNKASVTDIAKQRIVSRKFIHHQKDKATAAINQDVQ